MTLWRRVIVMTIRSLGHDTLITTRKYIFSMFSRHSEAFASECLENLEEMSSWYQMYNDVINRFKFSNA